jgi:NTE family protein
MFFNKKPKVGLALGSGAARGLSHIGVVKALLEKNVRIDMISGTSMGALVGAHLARHGTITGLEDATLAIDFKNLLRLADPDFFLLFKGFVAGNKVEEFLKMVIGDVEFKDLKIPLWVVASDIRTGEEIVINTGSVVKAVCASISMPVVFTPFNYLNRILVDGGISNPLPADVLRRAGAKFVIASNVLRKSPIAHATRPAAPVVATTKDGAKINEEVKRMGVNITEIVGNMRKMFMSNKNYDTQKREIPSIFETALGAIYTMEYQMQSLKGSDVDIMVMPEVDHISALEFYRAREAIDAGYVKAKHAVANILKKYLV